MNITFPDETYYTLLNEANKRDVSMARLCSQLLQTAARIIDKQNLTENYSEQPQRGKNEHNKTSTTTQKN
ncbi:hypothetical protein WIA93_10385 [Citrobacter amalonaticus]|uniref:hypothetical protein n=1 Tax=Citrobacter amalonaticus TaxID=35703 RepID=UPI00163DAA85|nr:hypothetical protein [Citrobacter amalonaticus]